MPPRVAVVGHVEWVTFARVPHLPRPGEILHASEVWDEAGGGGAVAAVHLRRRAGACLFLTALGDDPAGRQAAERLRELGVDLHAGARPVTRRGFTHTDDRGERTITVLGERIVPRRADPLPWERLARVDAVYFTGGDPAAARAPRAAPVLVATPRASAPLRAAGVEIDALVFSAGDADEVAWAEELEPLKPRYTVATRGSTGGTWGGADGGTGEWAAAEVPGPVVDAYGCGDSFAAGLTYALGAGEPIERALALAASWGAHTLTLRGPYG
ncbi:MAG TPA: PfkB family carbohydrate kinase [Solirubrobacteraceae bacterium]|nr:PfkB family carbohydrate kinase [Solirubrobacteraceae bacterium]